MRGGEERRGRVGREKRGERKKRNYGGGQRGERKIEGERGRTQ